jgi:hypothetical protein
MTFWPACVQLRDRPPAPHARLTDDFESNKIFTYQPCSHLHSPAHRRFGARGNAGPPPPVKIMRCGSSAAAAAAATPLLLLLLLLSAALAVSAQDQQPQDQQQQPLTPQAASLVPTPRVVGGREASISRCVCVCFAACLSAGCPPPPCIARRRMCLSCIPSKEIWSLINSHAQSLLPT